MTDTLTHDSSLPTVSVLMAVYNSEGYLAQAIESILTQTFPDFELIIIDDGSTDDSLAVMRHYAAQDSRIQLLTRDNRGVSTTRNELLALARSELIAVMDSDDIALPQRLELQVKFLQQHPDVVCVGGAFDIIDQNNRFLTRLQVPTEDSQIQKAALAGHTTINHPAAMMRRDPTLAVGGYDEAYPSTHDLDLWLKLGEIGPLANLPEAVIQYRIRSDSISGQNPIAQRQEARIVCEQAWQRRNISGVFEATDPWRPTPSPQSQHQFLLKYGWWAFNSKQGVTALIYGLRAVQQWPCSLKGWKLLLIVMLRSVQDWLIMVRDTVPAVIMHAISRHRWGIKNWME